MPTAMAIRVAVGRLVKTESPAATIADAAASGGIQRARFPPCFAAGPYAYVSTGGSADNHRLSASTQQSLRAPQTMLHVLVRDDSSEEVPAVDHRGSHVVQGPEVEQGRVLHVGTGPLVGHRRPPASGCRTEVAQSVLSGDGRPHPLLHDQRRDRHALTCSAHRLDERACGWAVLEIAKVVGHHGPL